MKRAISLILITALIICSFAGCGGSGKNSTVEAIMNSELNNNLAIWTTHSLDRVRKNRQPEGTKDFELYGAKGEYQSFQIVANSKSGNIELTDLVFTDFEGENGVIEAEKYVTVYREHYIAVNENSPQIGTNVKVEGTGMIPDALIPAVDNTTGEKLSGNRFNAFPFTLTTEECQPYWIDVEIPRTAEAGEYTATYALQTDSGIQKGTVKLTVWNIELAKELSQGVHFRTAQVKTEQRAIIAAQHKMFAPGYDAELEKKLKKEYGLNLSSVSFWSGANEATHTMNAAPKLEKVQSAAASRLEGLPIYAYTADEISGVKSLYEPLKEWARVLHQANVNQLVVMAPDEDLFDDGSGTGRSAVDIWVVLPRQYETCKELIKKAQQKGDQVWSYNCLVQDEFSPKWQLDYSITGFRIQPGFINYALGFDGFLYWLVDNWKVLEDPWTCLGESSLGNLYNGDGNLFYPGDDVGLVDSYAPSIRAKAIRDGLQDYELLKAIEAMGHKDIADEYAQLLGADFVNWERSGDVIINKRIEMGNSVQ
ncbi:MAG: DUF4091 domain-containing protein [Clostridia bacterium]|nr:DUF4091 domain-containing protein [Clostridia bacterium]